MPQTPRMSIEDARAALEQLRDATQGDQHFQPAPQRWIDELHEAVAVIATRKAQQEYRLDGLVGITMEYLHHRVLDVLRDFDRLVAERG